MKFEAERASLLDALQRVAPADSAADAAPFAGDVLLESQHNCLVLRTCEQAFMAKTRCETVQTEKGATVVAFKRLSDVLKHFSSDRVVASMRTGGLFLRAGGFDATLPTKDANSFPVQTPPSGDSVRLSAVAVRRALAAVTYAIHNDVTNPLATAELVCEADHLRAWATDGKRFALHRASCAGPPGTARISLGARIARKLASLRMDDDAIVNFSVGESHIFIGLPDADLAARRLHASGVSDDRWLALKFSVSCSMSRVAIADAVGLAAAPAGSDEGCGIRLRLKGQTLYLSAERGAFDAKSKVDVDEDESCGVTAEAVVGALHLQEAVGKVAGDRVTVSFASDAPVVVVDAEDADDRSRAILIILSS